MKAVRLHMHHERPSIETRFPSQKVNDPLDVLVRVGAAGFQRRMDDLDARTPSPRNSCTKLSYRRMVNPS